MMTSLLLGAALAAPGAPVPAGADPAPTGPAPWVIYLKADENVRPQIMVTRMQKVTQTRNVTEIVDGKPVAKMVTEQVDRLLTTYVQLDTVNAKFATAEGTTLTAANVLKKIKDGAVLLVSADAKPVSKSWLRVIEPEAIIVTSESLISETAPRSYYQVPSAAPRLVLFTTDMQGKVQAPYNPGATNNGGAYGRGGRVVMMGNGQQMFIDESGYYSPNPTPSGSEAPIKPLEKVEFDAYDLSGKAVPKADALKRLNAGGYALVAGESRVPDESYLKQFRGDLLVLVSAELVNVPTGKSKPGTAPVVRPLPAVIRPAIAPALKVAPLKVAPAPAVEKEEAPKPAPAPAKK